MTPIPYGFLSGWISSEVQFGDVRISRRDAIATVAAMTGVGLTLEISGNSEHENQEPIFLSTVFGGNEGPHKDGDIAIFSSTTGEPTRLRYFPSESVRYKPSSEQADNLACLLFLRELCFGEKSFDTLMAEVPSFLSKAEGQMATRAKSERLSFSELGKLVSLLQKSSKTSVPVRQPKREGLGDGEFFTDFSSEPEALQTRPEMSLVPGALRTPKGLVSASDQGLGTDLVVEVADDASLEISASAKYAQRFLLCKVLHPKLDSRGSMVSVGEQSFWLPGTAGLTPGRVFKTNAPKLFSVNEKAYVVAYGLGLGAMPECEGIFTNQEKGAALYAGLIGPLMNLVTRLIDAFVPATAKGSAIAAANKAAALVAGKAVALGGTEPNSPAELRNKCLAFMKPSFDEIVSAVAVVAKGSATALVAEAYLLLQTLMVAFDFIAYISLPRWQVQELELGEAGTYAGTYEKYVSYLIPASVAGYFTANLKAPPKEFRPLPQLQYSERINEQDFKWSGADVRAMSYPANRAELEKRCRDCRLTVAGMTLPVTYGYNESPDHVVIGASIGVFVSIPIKKVLGRGGGVLPVELQVPDKPPARLGYIRTGVIQISETAKSRKPSFMSEEVLYEPEVLHVVKVLASWFVGTVTPDSLRFMSGKPVATFDKVRENFSQILGAPLSSASNEVAEPVIYYGKLEFYRSNPPGITNPPAHTWLYDAETVKDTDRSALRLAIENRFAGGFAISISPPAEEKYLDLFEEVVANVPVTAFLGRFADFTAEKKREYDVETEIRITSS